MQNERAARSLNKVLRPREIGYQSIGSEMGEEKNESTLWSRAGKTGIDFRNSLRTTGTLKIGETIPFHAIPNGYAAYSQNVGSLGFVALRLGKRINELLSL